MNISPSAIAGGLRSLYEVIHSNCPKNCPKRENTVF